MRLDVRIPIGLMFGLTGVLLVGYGLVSDPAIYERSLGVNINLWWGLGLVVFSAVMLGLAFLASRAAPESGGEKPSEQQGGNPHVAL